MLFQVKYKCDDTILTIQDQYPDKLVHVLKTQQINPKDILQITGPRKNQEISYQTLLRIAAGNQMLPGQIVKTPRFMSILISHMFLSESEAKSAGYTDNSGYKSENISIFGKILPNGRPVFAAALK